MNISFAWWNTSLSPVGKQRATGEQKSVALKVIDSLTNEMRIDCLALGEVTSEDLQYFQSELDLRDYELFDGTFKKGKLQFDTGVLYRKNTFYLKKYETIDDNEESHSLKVAIKLELKIVFENTIIHLFVSHWPSRLWCEKNSPIRHRLGIALRKSIKELYADNNGTIYAILAGDYNDEPFDSSLAEQLLASRDRRLVRKKPTLLYNPFWRHLGEAYPYIPGTSCQNFSGSCHYSSDPDTHWRTFDPIIFSSAFLEKSEWQLNEKHTKILYIEPCIDSVVSARGIFDHFPVISIIEKDEYNGELY